MRRLWLLLSLMATALVAAPAEPLVVIDGRIYSISSFPLCDYLCVFDTQGNLVFELPFSSSICDWTLEGNALFVLSKSRQEAAYYVTAIQNDSGDFLWEKTINGPSALNTPASEAP